MGNPMVTLVVAMESGRWLSTGMSNVFVRPVQRQCQYPYYRRSKRRYILRPAIVVNSAAILGLSLRLRRSRNLDFGEEKAGSLRYHQDTSDGNVQHPQCQCAFCCLPSRAKAGDASQ